MHQQQPRIERYIKLCGLHHGQPLFTLGPDHICFIATFVLVNAISLALIILLNKTDETAQIFLLVHVVILIYLDISWVATAFINPGIVYVDNNDDYPCQFCLNPYAEILMINPDHCQICQTCIEDRKHHCKITGGCIGKSNKIPYYFFLLGMFMWVVDFASTLPYAYYLL